MKPAKIKKIRDGYIYYRCDCCEWWLKANKFAPCKDSEDQLSVICKNCQEIEHWEKHNIRNTNSAISGLCCCKCGVFFTHANNEFSVCEDCFQRKSNIYPLSKYPELPGFTTES